MRVGVCDLQARERESMVYKRSDRELLEKEEETLLGNLKKWRKQKDLLECSRTFQLLELVLVVLPFKLCSYTWRSILRNKHHFMGFINFWSFFLKFIINFG